MRYQNNILLDLFQGKDLKRPPVWVMRQAGRILPGYRQIRSQVNSFKTFVKNPELVAQATIEPLHILGVDAAILFSDILVIPEAMGVDYKIEESIGPVFKNPIKSVQDIAKLTYGLDTLEDLSYVFKAIAASKTAIGGTNPLIGFAGAPWTLFAYMIEGKGSKTFAKARKFLYENPSASHVLLEKISETTACYLKEKINHGVDVIQLFDSWAYMLTPEQYKEFCIPYIQLILESIEDTPKIFFPKGAWSSLAHINDIAYDALGIDWQTPFDFARKLIGNEKIIQGNFDPCLLYAEDEVIQKTVGENLHQGGKKRIVNLGHGVYPDTDREKVKLFVDTVKAFSYPK